MGEDVPEIRAQVIEWFPKLASDSVFKVTSPRNKKYNCIAWAYLFEDRWMWPYTTIEQLLDGVNYWPEKKVMTADVSNFIRVFQNQGYEICDDHSLESGYRKIALYVRQGTTRCTHASRQNINTMPGTWASKLGEEYDIHHADPYLLEGSYYGIVHCIMKRKV